MGPRRDLAVGTREKAAREVRERKSLIHSQIIRGGGPTERFGGGPTARPGKPFPDAFSDPTATAAKATRSWRWDSFRELFFVPTATGAKATRLLGSVEMGARVALLVSAASIRLHVSQMVGLVAQRVL